MPTPSLGRAGARGRLNSAAARGGRSTYSLTAARGLALALALVSAFALACSLATAGCDPPAPAYPKSPEWDRARGCFQNPVSGVKPDFIEFLARVLSPSARAAAENFVPPVVKNDGSLLRDHQLAPDVTWIGHATTLIQIGSHNILTDPNYARRLIGLPRLAPPGIPFANLPPIDIVLVSHDHRDHLDEETVRALGRRPLYVVPLGIGAWLRKRGIDRVVELDWWQSVDMPPTGAEPPLRITLVPAIHWAQRGLRDADRRLWGGFVVEGNGLVIYFAGDTGYGVHFREIHARFPHIDLAMLPIGAYAPRPYFNSRHMSPEDAAQALRDLDAASVVPIHWGTFRLGEEPLSEPPQLFLDALGPLSSRAWLLPIGGVLRLPKRASISASSAASPASPAPASSNAPSPPITMMPSRAPAPTTRSKESADRRSSSAPADGKD